MTPTDAEGSSSDQPPKPMPERHSILIEKFCVRRGRFRKRRHPYAVQNVPFEFWLRVTNRGTSVFPGAILRELKIKGTGISLGHVFVKEFGVSALNPGKTEEIRTESLTTPLKGPVWVECAVSPSADNYAIDTFVSDPATGEVSPLSMGINFWRDIWFIQDQMETQQARTNAILLLLAALTLLEGVFGLKVLATSFLHAVGSFFLWLGQLLTHS